VLTSHSLPPVLHDSALAKVHYEALEREVEARVKRMGKGAKAGSGD
jgi:hypothetical protein